MAAPIAESKNEPDREFKCKVCELTEKYKYFGRKPPFAENYKFLEDVYLIKDPFSAPTQASFLLLGSNCSLCGESVCQSQECSLFFSKRFCLPCAKSNASEFPNEVQQEISKHSQKLTGE